MGKQVLDISTSTIIRTVLVLLAVAFIFSIWQILASVFLAIVIASAVEPAVRGLAKIKIPRFFAALAIYVVGILVFTSVFYAILPSFIAETRQLSADLPSGYSNLVGSLEQFFGKTPVNLNIQERIGGFLGDVQQNISSSSSNIFSFTFNLFGGIMSFILVFVFSFYLVLQKDGIEHFLKSIIPINHQEYAVDLWKRVQSKLGKWFRGQLLLGIFVGTFLFAALWLMGVKYALSIAFMAGVLEIIPVIGPIIAGLLAFALVSFQSPLLALGVIGIYILIEQLQQHLFVPRVMSKALGLNPIIIIVALLVAAKLIGFWGVILALPIAVMVSEFVKDFRKG